jgi:hypothetical protein
MREPPPQTIALDPKPDKASLALGRARPSPLLSGVHPLRQSRVSNNPGIHFMRAARNLPDKTTLFQKWFKSVDVTDLHKQLPGVVVQKASGPIAR